VDSSQAIGLRDQVLQKPQGRALIRLGVVEATVLLAAFLGCGKRRDVHPEDTSGGVRTPMTHDAEPIAAAGCQTSSSVWCIVDTAVVDQPSQSINPSAKVLWFATSGDSLRMSSDLGTVQTSIGSIVDSLHNNVSFFSGPVVRDGAVTVWIDISDERGDTVAYTLLLVVQSANKAISRRSTGLTSKLTVSPDRTRKLAKISIVPLSELREAIDRSAWQVMPGTYRVAMTRDSLYELCVLPCALSDTIKLKPRQAVRWVN
jgi:hypothetical protein